MDRPQLARLAIAAAAFPLLQLAFTLGRGLGMHQWLLLSLPDPAYCVCGVCGTEEELDDEDWDEEDESA